MKRRQRFILIFPTTATREILQRNCSKENDEKDIIACCLKRSHSDTFARKERERDHDRI